MYENFDIGYDLKMAFEDGYRVGVEATQPRWISVDDILPDKGSEVLLCDKGGVIGVGYYTGTWYSCNTPYRITHWMPLPEAPKEDIKNERFDQSQFIDYRRYNEVKVFISQPMNGKDEQTILKERAKMISRIKEQYPDAEILESYFEDYKPSTGNVALKYLSKSLELLADADEAWFAPGWQNARGCRIENDCAIAYGITVHEI